MEKKRGDLMKKIEAYFRPEKLEAVKEALDKKGIKGMTISQVRGHGAQKGIKLMGRAGEYCLPWIDKIKLELVISDTFNIDEIIDAIVDNAQTGKPGDGKIFITPVIDAIRIRTKEKGEDIL